MDNKKNIIIIIVILIITTVLGYISYKVLDKGYGTKINGKAMFTMYTDNGDLYSLNEKNESFKLLEASIKPKDVKYKESSKEHIILDEQQNLFSINEKGERRNIASNVLDYKISDYKGNVLYYKDKDNNLYKNVEDKEDLKIDNDVDAFKIFNNEVIYLKDLKDVYIKSGNKESEKISIEPMLLQNQELKEKKILFVEENKVYSYEIKKNSKNEIMDISVDEENPPIFIEEAYRGIFYLTMDFYSEKGIEIHYKNKYKESITLAEKVSDYKVSKDKKGVYYIIQDKEKVTFYYKEFSEKEAVNIYEGKNQGSILMATKDGIIVNTDEDIIYNIDPSGHKERIGSDPLSSIQEYKDNIVYLNANNDLYIGKAKVAGEVKSFLVKEDFLAYITEDNKVFLIKNNKKPELVVENAKDYNKIYFNNEELFKNIFEQSDIIGSWQEEDNENIIFNFENKTMSMVTEYSNPKFKYKVVSDHPGNITTLDKMILYINIEMEDVEVENDFIKLEMIDNDTLKIKDKNYKKIDKDTFKNFASKDKKAKESIKKFMGLEYFDLDVKCSNIMFYNEKKYILYKSTSDKAPSMIFIDENGLAYSYTDWKHYKKLVEEEAFNNMYVNREEEKLVPYNKDRAIDISKVKSKYEGSVLSNPNYIKWEAALEITASDFFKERTDLNEEDVLFVVSPMEGSYYIEVMKGEKHIRAYEISPIDGVIAMKR